MILYCEVFIYINITASYITASYITVSYIIVFYTIQVVSKLPKD